MKIGDKVIFKKYGRNYDGEIVAVSTPNYIVKLGFICKYIVRIEHADMIECISELDIRERKM